MNSKIGFVLDDSLDKSDGVQQYILTLGKWLQNNGHEVHYLVGETHRRDIKNLHSLSRNIAVRFNRNRMSMPLGASRRRLKKLLAREQFDVLHVQMPYSPWLAARIIKAAPTYTGIVGTFHIIPFSGLHRLASRGLAVWLKSSLRRFDHILSVSEPARDFALSHYGVRSQVLPNAIDLKAFRGGPKTDVPDDGNLHIVFLGRLVERKGCLQLLEATRILCERSDLTQGFRVTIAGRGPLDMQLRRFCETFNLGHVVRFAGFIEENEKVALLGSADIAVFPSLGGESFGIVLLEAMGARAGVVIGGNNAGYASVLHEWPECLFDPSDAARFADTLEGLMLSNERRKRLHALQQAAIARFDVAYVGPKLLDIYESVIAKKTNY